MVRMLANLVRAAGVEDVRTAHDAASARAQLDGEAAPALDLLVTEWDLPGESGLELIRALREEPARAALPVILVSARNSRLDVEKAVQAGVNGYVLKPVNPGLFGEKVAGLVSPDPQSAAA